MLTVMDHHAMHIHQRRISALRRLIGQQATKDFAEEHDLDASYLSQILNGHRNMGEKAAAKMEAQIGLEPGALVSPPFFADIQERSGRSEQGVRYSLVEPASTPEVEQSVERQRIQREAHKPFPGRQITWHDLALGADVMSHKNIKETHQPYATERKYPLISDIAAGTWMESCDNFHPGDADEWLSSERNAGPHGYWLSVKGRSMEPHFMNGDRILVQPEGFDIINGKFYVAKLLDSGDTTFKQYIKDAGIAYLQPLNDTFPLIQVTDNVEIIGRVIDKRLDPSFF